MPRALGEDPSGENSGTGPPSMAEGEDPFSERVIAELEREGLTINWRYGYKLANRYEVKRVCGGGQAVVYIVEDPMEEGKRYAAKSAKGFFRKPETDEEWEKWRESANDYLEECKIWADLGKHRHIVHAEFLDKIEGVPLVMSEFIDGGGLDDWLERGPLDVATALDFAIQSCIGMEYANEKGLVVHRDIKPGNILVTRNGVAKVNDFGIARAIESAEAIRPEAVPKAPLDRASLGVSRGRGTPAYMAPEQFHEPLLNLKRYPAVPLGIETDIYAFGLVLYEMITGECVARMESDRDMEIWLEAIQIVSRFGIDPGYVYCFLKAWEFTPPRCSRNEHLNAVVQKCLEKEPSERYHSFSELREELMRIYRDVTGREFRVIEEPPYEPNWWNMGKTYWILGREEESFECYDRALEQKPGEILAWLGKGLASAEAGDLEEFGLCMEAISYLKPSWETEVQKYKEIILNDDRVLIRDIRLLDRLASEYTVSEMARGLVLEKIEQPTDPFRESNPVLWHRLEGLRREEETVRWFAAKDLGELGDRSSVPALIEALKDESGLVRSNAAQSLGRLGDASAVSALIEALKDDFQPVRENAADALGELGDGSAVTALTDALEDKVGDVRSHAARALGKLGEPSAIPALMEALKDEYSLACSNAALSLRELGDTSAVPALIEALRHGDVPLRRKVAAALHWLGDKSAAQALIEALKDEDSEVREQAAWALGDLGVRSAVPALIEALNDGSTLVRIMAASSLGKLGDRSASSALIDVLKHADSWHLRMHASRALGRLGDRSAVPALIEALKDEVVDVRSSATEALGELGDSSALPALTEALKYDYDEYADVGRKAADALGKLRDVTAMPALIDRLKDEDTDALLRKSAARALGELRDRAAVPALIEALKGKDVRLWKGSAEVLAKLADRQIIPRLLEALASFPEPNRVLVAMRWVCSQPDEAKLSQTKDKLREYSAFEMSNKGSELVARGEYARASECFERAIEIDPDWEEPKKARDDCLRLFDMGS